MNIAYELENELVYLGLLDKAREIYSELGEDAVLSYIRSSYRLLSKVYHPDHNPRNRGKAEAIQQRLNRFNKILDQMPDDVLVDLIMKGIPSQTSTKKRILIVEDEDSLRELFKDVLLVEGYDVRVAGDGLSGYKQFCQFEPDLLLADVVIPKITGLALVRKLRRMAPRIKVIFVSGFFGIERLKKELDQEISKYGYGVLSKPFKISQLLELVEIFVQDSFEEPGKLNVYI
ncbi:Response regulator receiver protein [uncultured Desulfobacterium sp.]|uniref:Response regulator receiver protein n=1 Tax=uncultured Desulfobacterium sp. TaxID=201089 RepID=A0A445N450_9BACT|nr:Response regulator receiver protein [uncultured Desulfobacterium sp.]